MCTEAAPFVRRGYLLVALAPPCELDLIVGMLSGHGYKVHPVTSGALAIEAACQQPPDLVLLGAEFPDMDGHEACERLLQQESLRDIPILLCGNELDADFRNKAFQAGAVDLVTRPFVVEQLRERIDLHLCLRKEMYAHFSTERLLERLLNLSAEAIIYVDRNGVARRVNDTFLSLWDLKKSEVENQPIHQIPGHALCCIPGKDDPKCCMKLMASDVLRDEETVPLTLNGEEKTLIRTRILVQDQKGRPLGVLIQYLDINKQLAREEALNQQNRELIKFNQSMVDREMRMIELKEEVNRLSAELGRPPPYESVWTDQTEEAPS